jgi:hypothetical protein
MWQSIIGFVFSKIEKTFPQKKRGKMWPIFFSSPFFLGGVVLNPFVKEFKLERVTKLYHNTRPFLGEQA